MGILKAFLGKRLFTKIQGPNHVPLWCRGTVLDLMPLQVVQSNVFYSKTYRDHQSCFTINIACCIHYKFCNQCSVERMWLQQKQSMTYGQTDRRTTDYKKSTMTMYKDREIHLSVKDLQSTTRLAKSWKMQIFDPRTDFPVPAQSCGSFFFSFHFQPP